MFFYLWCYYIQSLAFHLTGSQVNKIFAENAFDAVMHFAAVAYVGESTMEPLRQVLTCDSFDTQIGDPLVLFCTQYRGNTRPFTLLLGNLVWKCTVVWACIARSK
jgi:hypothetical protein